MIGFPSGVRIHLALEPHDMRKSFNGLASIAGQLAARGLESGALFAFTNKRRNRLKMLYYDRTSVCVLAKRLETGTFAWPAASSGGASSLSLAPEALQLLLDGVDLRGAEMRPWYERQESSPEIWIYKWRWSSRWSVTCCILLIETPEETGTRQARELTAARYEIASLKEANRLLEQKLDHLIRRLFGNKSEKIDPAQLELLFKDLQSGKEQASTGADAPEEAVAAPEPMHLTKRGGHRSRITGLDRLPVETTEVIPDLVAATSSSTGSIRPWVC